jgi:hypothetical protein
MLRALQIEDVGPAARLHLDLGERLNVLTGDNGLGKSFVLEVAWWALTGTWVERAALPQRGKEESARIAGEVERGDPGLGPRFESAFDRVTQDWQDRFQRNMSIGFRDRSPTGAMVPEWLYHLVPVLYIRPDGLFSLWDPVRIHASTADNGGLFRTTLNTRAIHFTPKELWDGLVHEGKPICNGLIEDWVTWQLEAQSGDPRPFQLLMRVLERLSHPEEPMKPGKPVRLYLNDARRFPTIEPPYGTIPIVHTSAGMKRILGLAYLITWMWTEHVQAAQMIGRKPADRLVVLFDEPETHLHPKWQRHIIPALLDVLGGLGEGMRPQILLTTHAPLVLASLEPTIDREKDRLFNFELRDREVELDELPWVKHGDALSWLTSNVFAGGEAFFLALVGMVGGG